MKKFIISILCLLCLTCSLLALVGCGSESNSDSPNNQKEPEHVHSYVDSIVEPTCIADGYTLHKCSCGDEYIDNTVSALGHSFTNYVSNNDATCTQDGTKTAKCDRCDATENLPDVNSKLAHTFNQEVASEKYLASSATCTQKARCYYSCKCGEKGTETFEYGSALGHSFTNYVSDDNATYDADGTKTALCDNGCGTKNTITDDGTQLEGKIEFSTLTVSGDKVYGKVSNSTDFFSFIKEVKTYGSKTKFVISYDAYGENQIFTKTISLNVGNNITYILEMYDGEPKNVYQVTIRRKPIYNVSFDTANGASIESQQVEEDALATKPITNPTRLGYNFNGFDYDFTSPIVQDTIVTANWNAIDYNIKYKVDDKEIATENPQIYTVEDVITLSLPQVTKTGYTASWSDGGKIEKGSTGDKTFEVVWTPIVYTITYNLDGGENNEYNPITYTIEDKIVLQAPSKLSDVVSTDVATYAGDGIYNVEQLVTAYTFAGWFTEENFENEVTTISGTDAVVLYACWCKNTTTATIQQAYLRDGSYIYFGSYPQTKVTDDPLIASLNTLAGEMPTNANCQKWTSYLYFIYGTVSNYMWYIDVEYSEAKYRGVYFTSYRPYYCYADSSFSYQDNNGYDTSTIYWFKYEPIKWQILEEMDGCITIVAELALDCQQFYHTREDDDSTREVNGNDVYENNYEESEIRAWLNDTFFNAAFNDLQKALIQTVTVDNSSASTRNASSYACDNTKDKVWLLSYNEAFSKYSGNLVRAKTCTDYARCQGCPVYSSASSTSYKGNCTWWLRSPNKRSSYVWCVGASGSAMYDAQGYNIYEQVSFTGGIVPALKVKLS